MAFTRSVAFFVYAVLATSVSMVFGALACIGQPFAEYMIASVQVLYTRPSGLPARKRVFTPPAGGDPARPSYFYGPARSDVHYIRQVAWSEWQRAAQWWQEEAVGALRDPDTASPSLTWPVAAGLTVGLIVALPLAALPAGAVWLIQEMLVGVATVGVRCTAAILRAVDSGLLFVRHVQVRCVACFEGLSYPAYLCPNLECRDIHWDIRPGPYGVLRRKCHCGQPMPTLLLLGAARKLDAICSNRACKQPLEHRPGEEREVIFPLFGAKGAGKTLLLYGIIKTLQASVRPGIRVETGDASTASRIRDLDSALAEDYPVPATAAELPKAYVLRLRIGRYRRIVQLIDAAGELFYSSQRSEDLVYLGAANTFVLVIDPLSINDFWDRLPSAKQDRLAAGRSVAPHPQPVYQQTADRITEMGGQRAPRRLAIVLSRADVIGQEFGPGASTGDGVRTWAEDALGLAGLIREAKFDFRDVALFHTAPFGSKENCLTDLVHWLMRAEGAPLDLAGRLSAGRKEQANAGAYARAGS